MTDFLATALGLAFAFVVCLLAINAIVGPWLRMRRAASAASEEPESSRLRTV